MLTEHYIFQQIFYYGLVYFLVMHCPSSILNQHLYLYSLCEGRLDKQLSRCYIVYPRYTAFSWYGGSIILWRAMTWVGFSKLALVEGRMNSDQFCSMMLWSRLCRLYCCFRTLLPPKISYSIKITTQNKTKKRILKGRLGGYKHGGC